MSTQPNHLQRRLAAGLLLVTAAVHVPLIPEHLREAPYIGVLFIALVVACSGLAAALVIHPTPATWLLTATLAVLAVAAFLMSRTVGLPQLGDDVGNWTEPLGFPALIAETLVIIVAGRALFRLHATTAEGIA